MLVLTLGKEKGRPDEFRSPFAMYSSLRAPRSRSAFAPSADVAASYDIFDVAAAQTQVVKLSVGER